MNSDYAGGGAGGGAADSVKPGVIGPSGSWQKNIRTRLTVVKAKEGGYYVLEDSLLMPGHMSEIVFACSRIEDALEFLSKELK